MTQTDAQVDPVRVLTNLIFAYLLNEMSDEAVGKINLRKDKGADLPEIAKGLAQSILQHRAMQAAMGGGAVKVKPLVWSEHRPPGEKCPYDHITAPSALGEFSIEWKSWKDYPCYCIYVDGELIGTGDDLSDAKAIGSAYLDRVILSALEPAAPQDTRELEVEGFGRLPVLEPATTQEGAEPRGCPTPGACSCPPTPAPEPGSFDGLVERLRYRGQRWAAGQRGGELDNEAADAITTLRQQLAVRDAEASFWERAYSRRTGQAIEARTRVTAAEAERDALREVLAEISNAYTAHSYSDAMDAVQALKDIAREALK